MIHFRIHVTVGLLFLLLLGGCSAMQTMSEYKDVKIYTYSDNPFVLQTKPKTAYLDYRVPKELTGIEQGIKESIAAKGIRLVESADNADVVFLIVLSNANTTSTSSRRVQGRDTTAAGGALVGAGGGFLATGNSVGTIAGALAGMTGGALVDVTVNSWVTLDELRIRGDMTVLEKISGQGPGYAVSPEKQVIQTFSGIPYMRHESRVSVRAQKANLSWDDCREQMIDALSGALLNHF